MAAGGLTSGIPRAGLEPVEITAHQLRAPAFGHVVIDPSARSMPRIVRTILFRTVWIADLDRECLAGSRQALGVVFSEITFVEFERRLAVELEQHPAGRAGDPAAGPNGPSHWRRRYRR